MARALELDPDHRGARVELARYLMDEGSFERAEEEIRRVLEAHPIDVEVQLIHARLLKQTDRRDEALRCVERVLRFAPRFCEALLERLTLLVELGGPEEAREAFGTLRKSCRDAEVIKRGSTLVESPE